MIADQMVKDAATEYLSHKGERPYRVLRGGQELWETCAPAMRHALTAALQGSVVVPEWQDISTALRDGTRFQAGHFDPVNGDFRQFVCFWNPGWAGVDGVSDAGPFWQAGGLLEHPTHWQPLPTPPLTRHERNTPQPTTGGASDA
jgi:hypothetical protein